MARLFTIAGPCNPVDNDMLSATERLPEGVSLINKKQCFVVYVPKSVVKSKEDKAACIRRYTSTYEVIVCAFRKYQ